MMLHIIKLYVVKIQIVILLLLFTHINAEQIGIFKSNIPLNSKNDLVLIVPNGVVALSGSIPIEGDSTEGSSDSTSLFFIVDNSGSMEYNGRDPKMNRMNLISRIVDTLSSNSQKFPNIECGLAVFGEHLYYKESENPLLLGLPLVEDSIGAYLPLVELDKDYGNSTGGEVIKELVKTEFLHISINAKDTSDYIWYSTDPDYIKAKDGKYYHVDNIESLDSVYKLVANPAKGWESGTYFDYGFKAAVESMKKSQCSKNNHYIIFLSDGESYDQDYADGFINGLTDPIPTTFTIFFTDCTTTPQSLEDMTDTIKVNGYSNSNEEHTNLIAYKNTTIEALVGYVMDSIVSIFESGKTTTPTKIVINNDSSENWSASNGMFSLSHPLALTDYNTEFLINLSITIYKDSLDLNGEIIEEIEKDTSFIINTEVIIDEEISEENAKGEIDWWDRNISILNDNMEKNIITELDNNLKVRFEYDPMNSGYKYENVGVVIKCKESGDSLYLNCDSINNFIFEKQLKINSNITMKLDDDIITPDTTDEIIIIFRNNESYKLPLDTLQVNIPYNQGSEYKLLSGSLFDDDANGLCDRVRLKISGEMDPLQKGIKEIVSLIELPLSRKLSIDSIFVSNNIIDIITSSEEEINTGRNEDDFAEVKSLSVISTGGILAKSKIVLSDSMAPVIIEATLYNNPLFEIDSLNIKFSEIVEKVTESIPFYLYDNNNDRYIITLSNSDKKGSIQSFNVNDMFADSVNIGDSINISIVGKVSDTLSNAQLNNENLKIEIKIEKPGLSLEIESIVFLDPKGQGFPSEVKVKCSKILTETCQSSFQGVFKTYLENINNRDLFVSSMIWKNNICVYVCLQDNNNLIKTIVTDNDKFQIVDKKYLSDDVWIENIVLEPIDSMAPVLIEAICIDSIATDSISHLQMKFSEEIKDPGYFNNNVPFLFKEESNIFPVKLFHKSFDIDALHTIPNNRLKSNLWNDIDSVRINSEFEISDNCNNTVQKSSENRLVKLMHMKIAPPLEFKLNTTMISSENPESYIVISPLNELSLKSDDKIEGTITIIDQVGNHIIKDRPIEFNSSNKEAILKWDGKNDAGRKVGSGIYPVIANVKSMTNGNVGGDFDNTTILPTHEILGTVGVKY